MSEAIGMIETKGYTGSIEATDAMAKAANITITKTIPITFTSKGPKAASPDIAQRSAAAGFPSLKVKARPERL